MIRKRSGSPTRAVALGILGAIMGMGIWILIGVLANPEIGWIAWSVGILTGYGFYYGDRRWVGRASGFSAAAIAFVAVLLGQRILVHQIEANFVRELKKTMSEDDVKMLIADEICEQRLREGRSLNWHSRDMNISKASKPQDYPDVVWQETELRFNELPEETKLNMQTNEERRRRDLYRLRMDQAGRKGFGGFSVFEGIFLALASWTAFIIAAGIRPVRMQYRGAYQY